MSLLDNHGIGVLSGLELRMIQDAHVAFEFNEQLERSLGGLAMQEVLRSEELYNRALLGPDIGATARLMQQSSDTVAELRNATDAIDFSSATGVARRLEQLWGTNSTAEAVLRASKLLDGASVTAALNLEAQKLASYGNLVKQVESLDVLFRSSIKSLAIELPVDLLMRNLNLVPEPWILIDDPVRSFEAFGALSKLAMSVTNAYPTIPPLLAYPPVRQRSARRSNDDDENASIDSRLNDLPSSAFVPLARAAGLRPRTVQTQTEDVASVEFAIALVGTGSWTDEAHRQVKAAEVTLRREVNSRLSAQLGANWHKHRVSDKVLSVWRSRQAEARVGKSEFLLDFATFGELRDVMLRADVWRDCFESKIAMTKQEMLIVLDRLMEIRHAADHGRELTRREFVWCFSEVDRVMFAFDVAEPDYE